MVTGRVENGVVVLQDGAVLPEGTNVLVVPEPASEQAGLTETRDAISEQELQRVLSVLDRIASLPIEGSPERFSSAGHDRILYG